MSDSLEKLKEQNIEDLYIAEAGIGIGKTFEYLALIAEKIGSKIVGFDSFKGFPEIKNPKDKCEIILGKLILGFLKKSKNEEIIRNIDEIIIKLEIKLKLLKK